MGKALATAGGIENQDNEKPNDSEKRSELENLIEKITDSNSNRFQEISKQGADRLAMLIRDKFNESLDKIIALKVNEKYN